VRKGSVLLGMLGLVGLFGAVAGGSAAAPALYSNSAASVLSVSCAAAGDCVAGGYYFDDSSGYHRQAFVVSETNGSWGKPIEVPGTATLNRLANALVSSVSCPAAGDCVAGGSYTDRSGNSRAFVASETNGVWGNAIEVPGTGTLNSATVESVSCGAVGNCAAAGLYLDGSDVPVFVVSETNGVWGDAIEIPGTATFNSDAYIGGPSLSCAAAGDCAAGGQYTDGSGHRQAFVLSEQNGVWGDAGEVPGTAALNSGGAAGVSSVSCVAPGDCAAGGQYTDGSGHVQAFVVTAALEVFGGETNVVWGDAIEVPGTGSLNSGGDAGVSSVSCAAADCAVGGGYTDGSGHSQAFVASETNGVWSDAIEVPGAGGLNSGGDAGVSSVSCGAAGDCAAGGAYTDGSGHPQAFVAGEQNGVWGDAIEAPGTATLNTGGKASVYEVSCAAAGDCAAGGGGVYTGNPSHSRAFVVSETNGSWSTAIAVRNFPASCVVPKVVGMVLRAAKTELHASHCGVGTITRADSKRRNGRVVAQRPMPGLHLPRGAKVALTVSTGKKT